MLCWAVVAVMAYNSWAALYNTGIIVLQGIVIAPGYAQLASFILQPNTMLVLGVFEFILIFLLNLLPPRIYHTIITILVSISLVCTLLLFIPLIGVSQTTFLANFQKYTGMTADQVISTAKAAGWDPNYFNWPAVASAFAYGMFAFFGFNFSSYMAGELKGNIQRNVLISLTVAMVVPIYQITAFLLPFYSVVPYDLINAWGYLFWNAPASAPLQAAPMTSLISTIANPSMAWFSIIAGYPVLVIFNFVMVVAYVALLTRITFAQTMDRLWPRVLSAVGKRTHQPTYLVIFWCFMGYIFFISTVTGYSPGISLWYGVLLQFLALLMPAVNAVVIHRRRADLFELIPTWLQKRLMGLPRLAWFGSLYICFLVPMYAVVEFWPLASAFMSTPITGFMNYVFSTGVLLVIFFLIAGTVWYFAALQIQKRRGIDVEMLFKSIPPE